ncbi:MAG: FprA family A-type flavoprotein [Dehalococcoidia bacterium]|nr:Nitric oxide reductase [Chloroflexota bacterium]MBT9161536.1 Nitric oxide reductase [Chloroflexota bacterium]
MSKVRLTEGVYWVGTIDWNIRNFHGYSTHRGTTYNAYLIIDEKIALIDTVKAPFFPEMRRRIKEIIDPGDIDYVVSNHVEMDHSGSLPMMMTEARKAQLITTEKFGEAGLKKHFHMDCRLIPVKESHELSLGKRKLTFIPIPMLHWPDSMATYLPQDQILFPSDAFGQHLASSQRFDDEVDGAVLMQEAAKYYANILMPFGHLMSGALKKLAALTIRTIAPSHGVIWRSDPEKIVSAYTNWSAGETINKALVIYDTMWGSTAQMARAIEEGLTAAGVEVKVFELTRSDRSDVMTEVLDARAIIVGSPTLNNGMFPTVAEFLCYLKGLNPRGKIGAAFGSYGWGGGATKAICQEMEQTGIEMVEPELAVKWIPEKSELAECIELGQRIGGRIK